MWRGQCESHQRREHRAGCMPLSLQPKHGIALYKGAFWGMPSAYTMAGDLPSTLSLHTWSILHSWACAPVMDSLDSLRFITSWETSQWVPHWSVTLSVGNWNLIHHSNHSQVWRDQNHAFFDIRVFSFFTNIRVFSLFVQSPKYFRVP